MQLHVAKEQGAAALQFWWPRSIQRVPGKQSILHTSDRIVLQIFIML